MPAVRIRRCTRRRQARPLVAGEVRAALVPQVGEQRLELLVGQDVVGHGAGPRSSGRSGEPTGRMRSVGSDGWSDSRRSTARSSSAERSASLARDRKCSCDQPRPAVVGRVGQTAAHLGALLEHAQRRPQGLLDVAVLLRDQALGAPGVTRAAAEAQDGGVGDGVEHAVAVRAGVRRGIAGRTAVGQHRRAAERRLELGEVALPLLFGHGRAAGAAPGSRHGTTSSARACSGRLRASGTARSAAVGMEGKSASAGSCTRQSPPWRRTTASPAAPSSSSPVSTAPTTRVPAASAAARSIASCEGREPFSVRPMSQHDTSVDDEQVGIGVGDDHLARAQDHAVAGCPHGQRAGAGQDLREVAARARRQVQGDEDGRGQVGGQLAGEGPERLDAAGGRADDDQVSHPRSVVHAAGLPPAARSTRHAGWYGCRAARPGRGRRRQAGPGACRRCRRRRRAWPRSARRARRARRCASAAAKRRTSRTTSSPLIIGRLSSTSSRSGCSASVAPTASAPLVRSRDDDDRAHREVGADLVAEPAVAVHDDRAPGRGALQQLDAGAQVRVGALDDRAVLGAGDVHATREVHARLARGGGAGGRGRAVAAGRVPAVDGVELLTGELEVAARTRSAVRVERGVSAGVGGHERGGGGVARRDHAASCPRASRGGMRDGGGCWLNRPRS